MSDFTVGDLCSVIAKSSKKRNKSSSEDINRKSNPSIEASQEIKNVSRKRNLSDAGEDQKKRKSLSKKLTETSENGNNSFQDGTVLPVGKKESATNRHSSQSAIKTHEKKKSFEKKKSNSSKATLIPPQSNKSLNKKGNKLKRNESNITSELVKNQPAENRNNETPTKYDDSVKRIKKKKLKSNVNKNEEHLGALSIDPSLESSKNSNVASRFPSQHPVESKKKKKKSIVQDNASNKLNPSLEGTSNKDSIGLRTKAKVVKNKKKKTGLEDDNIQSKISTKTHPKNSTIEENKNPNRKRKNGSVDQTEVKRSRKSNEFDEVDKDALESTFTAPIDPKHLGIKNNAGPKKKPDRKGKSKKMLMIERRLGKSLPTKHPDDEKKTIFVGNVDSKLKRKKIERHFKIYGKVDTVRIRGIPVSDMSMSKKEAITTGKLHAKRETVIAYVRFLSEESVEKALVANGSLLGDRHIRVDRSVSEINHEKNSVFIGNLCFEAENEEVYKFFEECGKITNVRIVRANETGASKGFGFVSFEKREAVELALELDGKQLYGKPLRINRTVKKQKPMKKDNKQTVFKHQRLQNKKQNNSFMKNEKSKTGDDHSFAGEQVSKSGKMNKKKNGPSKEEKMHTLNAAILEAAGGQQNKRILFED